VTVFAVLASGPGPGGGRGRKGGRSVKTVTAGPGTIGGQAAHKHVAPYAPRAIGTLYTDTNNVAAKNHNVVIPAGVQNGDTLLVVASIIVYNGAFSPTLSSPAWGAVFSIANPYAAGANTGHAMAVFMRSTAATAAMSGTTVTVSQAGANPSVTDNTFTARVIVLPGRRGVRAAVASQGAVTTSLVSITLDGGTELTLPVVHASTEAATTNPNPVPGPVSGTWLTNQSSTRFNAVVGWLPDPAQPATYALAAPARTISGQMMFDPYTGTDISHPGTLTASGYVSATGRKNAIGGRKATLTAGKGTVAARSGTQGTAKIVYRASSANATGAASFAAAVSPIVPVAVRDGDYLLVTAAGVSDGPLPVVNRTGALAGWHVLYSGNVGNTAVIVLGMPFATAAMGGLAAGSISFSAGNINFKARATGSIHVFSTSRMVGYGTQLGNGATVSVPNLLGDVTADLVLHIAGATTGALGAWATFAPSGMTAYSTNFSGTTAFEPGCYTAVGGSYGPEASTFLGSQNFSAQVVQVALVAEVSPSGNAHLAAGSPVLFARGKMPPSGRAHLATAPVLTVQGRTARAHSGRITASGALAAGAGVRGVNGRAALTVVGKVTGTGVKDPQTGTVVALAAGAVVAARGVRPVDATGSVSAAAALTGRGTRHNTATARLAAAGVLSGTGQAVLSGGARLAGSGAVTAGTGYPADTYAVAGVHGSGYPSGYGRHDAAGAVAGLYTGGLLAAQVQGVAVSGVAAHLRSTGGAAGGGVHSGRGIAATLAGAGTAAGVRGPGTHAAAARLAAAGWSAAVAQHGGTGHADLGVTGVVTAAGDRGREAEGHLAVAGVVAASGYRGGYGSGGLITVTGVVGSVAGSHGGRSGGVQATTVSGHLTAGAVATGRYGSAAAMGGRGLLTVRGGLDAFGLALLAAAGRISVGPAFRRTGTAAPLTGIGAIGPAGPPVPVWPLGPDTRVDAQ
jgi:hypothetical protein